MNLHQGPAIPLAMEQALREAARAAAGRAYAPYSRFTVGAAVLTADLVIHTGCNIENASYGLTICAERNAVFQAVAHHEFVPRILAVAIYTPTPLPTAPCGACRQVINEFGPDSLIISSCDGPDQIRAPLRLLLPHAFGPDNLAPTS